MFTRNIDYCAQREEFTSSFIVDYFHQIFGNASVLVSYRLDKTSGKLTEIGRNPIPYNSPQGLAGF